MEHAITEKRRGWARKVIFGLLLAAAVGLFVLAFREFNVIRPFRNPIAFTFVDSRLFVLEKDRNTLLVFRKPVPGRPLKLRARYHIEPDDRKYYYMVRKLYPGPGGLVVHSYIYDRATSAFLGYRFREYRSFDAPPRDILTIRLEDPDSYPEIRYTCDAAGNEYFVNNCIGQNSIWKLRPSVQGVVIEGGEIPPGIEVMGEKNDAFSSWGEICAGPEGQLYVSSHATGKTAVYSAGGRLINMFGEVGFDPGQLLAPENLMFVRLPGQDAVRLTVASTGNRSWVQFNRHGEVVYTLLPLEEGYPYQDILTGALYQVLPGMLHTFDPVNRCLVMLGDELTTAGSYEETRTVRALGLALAAVLLILYGVLLRIRKRRGRFIFPLFLKLLVLFVPLMMISAWIEGDWVRDVMKEELEEEYVLRSANLARAIVNSLDVEELEKIQKPEDRRSVTYEKIYNTVNDIVDTRHVSSTPKWILHKIRDGRYYFGISIWRGPIYEPFIVPADRKMFFEVLKQKESRYGCFTDEQGEWFSYLCPVTNHAGRVVNVVELYRPTEEMRRAEQHVTRKVGQVIGITLLVMVPLVLLFSLISTRPLHQLMQATKQLSKGDFSHRISVRSHDETAMLARAFNRMIVDLQKYTRDLERTTADKERIETELRFARDLQRDNLPAKFPPFKGAENVEIYARMEPARQIGGDYYDFFLIDRDHIGVVIADVSGKGMSAGLFMMVVRTLLRSNAMHNLNPASAVGKMNQLLAADNPACMFATLFYFVCNMRTGGVKYVNAGHNPPLVVRKGRAEPLPVKASADHGVATGVLETAEYRTRELHLNSGDRIILYTDGVTEPVNREEEMFGEERMIHIIEAHAAASNHALCDCIYDAVNAHQQGMEQFDDMTMLFFTWRGEG